MSNSTSNMANETLSKANEVAHNLMNNVQRGEARLEKASHDAANKVSAMASEVVDTTTEYAKSGREFVKENPVKSVAIAAAVGVVAGGLIALAAERGS